MFPHTGTQLYLLTMSFVPQPTNKTEPVLTEEKKKENNPVKEHETEFGNEATNKQNRTSANRRKEERKQPS